MLGRRLFSSKPAVKAQDRIFDFLVRDVVPIPELDITLTKLKHEPTGADHYHVSRDDPNNVFCVAFRTPPSDSTGVPHILEHTTLCGSKKYPVRDPFFKMLNRSLASYMNAWTASEHTAYPFCTSNPQDYANLRDVYCDAVFHPNLSKFDVLQEGWRLENAEVTSSESPLVFKGVVYNEMKGAFSDVESLFMQRLQQHALNNTLYAHVSGGDPLAIPSLTHEQLVEFHQKHYHPSNALFYTYGNLPVQETVGYLSRKLAPFSKSKRTSIVVPKDLPLRSRVDVNCPLDPMLEADKQCKMTLTFHMNDINADPQETFHLKILGHLLLDGSSSPLHQALIDSNIGQDYAPGTGYDSSTKLTTFSVGLQGIKAEDVERIQDIIMDTLRKVSIEGFSQSRIDSVLHLLELGTKNQSAQFGLSLLHRITSSWTFDVEPEVELALNDRIERFRQALSAGPLFQDLVKKYFMNNPNRMLFVMRPSADYTEKLKNDEDALLKQKVNNLTEADRKELFERNLELKKKQEAALDLSSLPCLNISDVSTGAKRVSFRTYQHAGQPKVWWRPTPTTNGISFFRTLIPLRPDVSLEEIKLLPLACQILTELGVEGKPIDQFDEDTKKYTGGINSSLHLGRHPWAPQTRPSLHLALSTYALNRNSTKALELLSEALTKPDFNNHAKLKSIIAANASGMMNSIASSGHQFAISRAASGLGLRNGLDEMTSGLSQAFFMNELAGNEDLTGIAQRLSKLIEKVVNNDKSHWRQSVITSDEDAKLEETCNHFIQSLSQMKSQTSDPFKSDSSMVKFEDTVAMPFSTSYSAKVYQFNPYDLKDSANLAILSKLLRANLLHKEIREKGGAYGGGASYSSLNGLFSFYSYRDPNPQNSLRVFNEAPGWFLGFSLSDQDLLEAKLSVFGALDAPVSVSSEGLHEFFHDISDVDRQLYRDELFKVTRESLKDTVEKLFGNGVESRTCVIGPSS